MDVETQAPLGTEAVSAEVTTPAAEAQEPTPIELKEDSLIRIPGSEKPVKFNEHVRGFQAQATRASQRAADLERKYKEAQDAIRRYEERGRTEANQPAAAPGTDALAQLESLTYTTGKDVATVVRAFAQEINARDQILIATLKQLQALQQAVRPISEANVNASFDSKIAGWLEAGGYPKEYTDLAKELYLAYEPGPELDEEFPQLFAERVKQVEEVLERKRRESVERARRAPFVPGKGGQTGPTRPLQLDPRNSAAADADALWEAIQFGSGT